MASGTCAICDGEARAGDRSCRACGADLEALVIDLDARDDPAAARAVSTRSPRLWRTPVVAACLVLVGAASWWLLADDGRAVDDAAPTSIARPTAASDDPALRTDGERTSGGDPTGVGPGGADGADGAVRSDGPMPAAGATVTSIDPAQLPEMEATHLAVAGDRRLYLLDLRTGDWSGRDVQNTPSTVHGVDDGVVLTGLVGGRLAFAPVGPGALIALGSAQNELLRIEGGGVVIRRWSASPPDVVATTFGGEQRWSYRPPPGMDVIGATSAGEVIVQAGQAIVGVDPTDGTTRPITDGTGFGVSADLLIVWRCDTELLCRTDQMDVATSESRVLTDAPIHLEPAGHEIFRGWVRGGNGRPFAYRLTDGWLERIDDEAGGTAASAAFDPTGITVSPGNATATGSRSAGSSTLVFRDPDGTVVAAIASPVRSGAPRVALVQPGARR